MIDATPPGREWPIGRIWAGGHRVAEPAAAALYASATNDPNPHYAGADAICPPMFHVRLMNHLLRGIMRDDMLGFDLLRLVHGEHDATFHRPIHPGDTVAMHARLDAVEEKSSGLLVTARLYGSVAGELAVACRTAYFIRAPAGQGKQNAGAAVAAATRPADLPRPADYTERLPIAPDQSLRYTAASLDDNPLHLDPAVAAAAGLPGVILQGLCTMAMTTAAFVRQAADGDPRRLRRFAVRFARPVYNGTTLTTTGRRQTDGTWAVETRNADDQLVLSNAVGELRP